MANPVLWNPKPQGEGGVAQAPRPRVRKRPQVQWRAETARMVGVLVSEEERFARLLPRWHAGFKT